MKKQIKNTKYLLFLLLITKTITKLTPDTYYNSESQRPYNPIILTQSENSSNNDIFSDQYIFYGLKIQFLKYGFSIFTPKIKLIKGFPMMKDEELKSLLENVSYKEFEFNVELTNLKNKKNCDEINFVAPQEEKWDDIFLYKNENDFLVLIFDDKNFEFFFNFQNFLKKNYNQEHDLYKIFLNNKICYNENEKNLFVNKKYENENIKRIDINLIFDITKIDVVKFYDFDTRNFNFSNFFDFIKKIFQFFFFLTKNKLTTEKIFVTKYHDFFYPFLKKMIDSQKNIFLLTKKIIYILQKKLLISIDFKKMSKFQNYFNKIFEIWKKEDIILENIFLFKKFKELIKKIFFDENKNFYFENFFLNDFNNFEEISSVKNETDFVFEENSLMNVLPNGFFDTVTNWMGRLGIFWMVFFSIFLN